MHWRPMYRVHCAHLDDSNIRVPNVLLLAVHSVSAR